MAREISQREHDAQERWVTKQGRAAAKFHDDMQTLRRIIMDYPDEVATELIKFQKRRASARAKNL